MDAKTPPSDPQPSGGGTATADAYDCRSCGACCHAREGTILVSQTDLLRWKRSGSTHILAQLEPGHFGQMAFAMSARGCCVHHGLPGAPHDCSIYEERAEVCRAYEPGNWQCLEARAERGVR